MKPQYETNTINTIKFSFENKNYHSLRLDNKYHGFQNR